MLKSFSKSVKVRGRSSSRSKNIIKPSPIANPINSAMAMRFGPSSGNGLAGEASSKIVTLSCCSPLPISRVWRSTCKSSNLFCSRSWASFMTVKAASFLLASKASSSLDLTSSSSARDLDFEDVLMMVQLFLCLVLVGVQFDFLLGDLLVNVLQS